MRKRRSLPNSACLPTKTSKLCQLDSCSLKCPLGIEAANNLLHHACPAFFSWTSQNLYWHHPISPAQEGPGKSPEGGGHSRTTRLEPGDTERLGCCLADTHFLPPIILLQGFVIILNSFVHLTLTFFSTFHQIWPKGQSLAPTILEQQGPGLYIM